MIDHNLDMKGSKSYKFAVRGIHLNINGKPLALVIERRKRRETRSISLLQVRVSICGSLDIYLAGMITNGAFSHAIFSPQHSRGSRGCRSSLETR